MSDGATVQKGVNPVGVGVVLLGALLALIGSFLPIHQYGAVAVEKNSYVAEGHWWVLVVALIMGAAAATALARGGGPGLVWRLGTPSAVALGAGIWGTTNHFQTLQTFGSLAALGNTLTATPGPGVYLVLAGGGIGLIGTGMTIGKWGPVGVPLYARSTKQCPECAERVLEGRKCLQTLRPSLRHEWAQPDSRRWRGTRHKLQVVWRSEYGSLG
jgi:hypothetical protein